MKKIAILGGAFDPVTNGHIQVAKNVLKLPDIDEVWLMISYKNTDKNMISVEHRIRMCDLAIKDEDNIKICTDEIDNKLDGGTLNLFQFLNNCIKYKLDYHFSMIIGTDQANNIKSWLNYKTLLKSIPFIVVPRKEYGKKWWINWFLFKPHRYIRASDVVCISSSKVRSTLKLKTMTNSFDRLNFIRWLKLSMNKNVLRYIEENKLYK